LSSSSARALTPPQEDMGLSKEGQNDGLRTVLLETEPWLLVLTTLSSVLHSVFSFLAFKNDVAFYKARDSFAGLSLRSLALNCFFQTVICFLSKHAPW